MNHDDPALLPSPAAKPRRQRRRVTEEEIKELREYFNKALALTQAVQHVKPTKFSRKTQFYYFYALQGFIETALDRFNDILSEQE